MDMNISKLWGKEWYTLWIDMLNGIMTELIILYAVHVHDMMHSNKRENIVEPVSEHILRKN